MTPQDLSTMRWVKSSRSANNGACVEVASTSAIVAVRDSKDVSGPILTVTPANWSSFLADVRTGAI